MMMAKLFTAKVAKRVRDAIVAYDGWHNSETREARLTWARVIQDQKQVFTECGINVDHILRTLDPRYHHNGGSA
jgi:hypothetical protein